MRWPGSQSLLRNDRAIPGNSPSSRLLLLMLGQLRPRNRGELYPIFCQNAKLMNRVGHWRYPLVFCFGVSNRVELMEFSLRGIIPELGGAPGGA
jgi:hypothetical protein